jgi:endogenous inhibitor of DNA gyrase (YacG/DUF329 family)
MKCNGCADTGRGVSKSSFYPFHQEVVEIVRKGNENAHTRKFYPVCHHNCQPVRIPKLLAIRKVEGRNLNILFW